MEDENDLKDKVVLITGASRGIGRAVSDVLARAGASLVLVARQRDDLDTVAGQLSTLTRVIAVPADVSLADDVDRVADVINRELGQLDILVNNVGHFERGPFEDMDETAYHRTFDNNVKGVFLMTRAALPYLRHRGGHIINMSSRSGRTGLAHEALFSAAKFAVAGFSQALREELRQDGIRVTCVFPGPVNTWGDPNPSQLLHPEDVAQAVLVALTANRHASIDDIVINPR